MVSGFSSSPWLLPVNFIPVGILGRAKLVAREVENFEPFIFIFGVQIYLRGYLTPFSSFARAVDNEQDLIFERAEVDRVPICIVGRQIKEAAV